MSRYTTQVRFICETYAGYTESQDFTKIDSIIATAYPKIFQNFPIFDESYRATLCTNILKRYYTQEIAFETVGLWKHYLNSELMLIMPYYNDLYNSQLLQFNVLEDADYYKEGTQDEQGTSKVAGNESNSTTTDNDYTRYNLYSDTPQGALNGVESQNYLSEATKETNDETTKVTGSRTSNESGNTTGNKEYQEHVHGKFPGKSYPQMIQEYRESLINIDEMIIERLAPFFMGVW